MGLFSFRKLRILLMDKKLKISNVCKECGLRHSVGTRINQDKNIEIESIAKICNHLKIPIEAAVEIVLNSNKVDEL